MRTYQQLADWINRSLSRNVIGAKQIDRLIQKAKRIRQQQGVWGLWNFASQLPNQFLTETEIEYLRQLPEYTMFAHRLIHQLIQEGVITPWEAKMLERYL